MPGDERVGTVLSMSQTQVNRLTNPQLKEALSTLINAWKNEEPSNSTLLEELQYLRADMAEIKSVKKEVERLSSRLEEAYKIIGQQQRFLESLDAKERRMNLVVTGVTEDSDEMGADDQAKVKNVIQATGYSGNASINNWQLRRLGQPNERRKRPILITVDDTVARKEILEKAKHLKNVSGPMATVYIKKDTHPAVRKEMARLRAREKEEKDKAENAGVVIRYDWKTRVLLRDDVVIDRYTPDFF